MKSLKTEHNCGEYVQHTFTIKIINNSTLITRVYEINTLHKCCSIFQSNISSITVVDVKLMGALNRQVIEHNMITLSIISHIYVTQY